ncbi:MAG: aldo/keto reductase [Jatrophihabitantaceae bacterium]
MTLPRKALGTSSAQASVLSLGSWHTWDRMPADVAVPLLQDAVTAGVNLFDVGWYNFGPHVEDADTDILFGRLVRQAGLVRTDYLLAEKLWLWNWPAQPLVDQLRDALARVGTDHADLAVLGDYLTELDVPRVVTEAAGLVGDGLARGWAVNNWAADDLAAAICFAAAEGMPSPVLAQLKYNVCRRSIPEGAPYRRLFAECGLGLQPSDVLEGGILAGHANPSRRIGADPGGIRDGIRDAAGRVATLAREFGVSPAQVAIAFVLTHPATTSVLVGVSRPEQLLDNLAAVQFAAEHGDVLRERLANLWLDRDLVEPTAAWATGREESPPAPPTT